MNKIHACVYYKGVMEKTICKKDSLKRKRYGDRIVFTDKDPDISEITEDVLSEDNRICKECFEEPDHDVICKVKERPDEPFL